MRKPSWYPWQCIVDPSRYQAGQRALQEGANCCVLDDGFQHRQLHRDCDIVTIDATRPWGVATPGSGVVTDRYDGWTLPLGLCREGPSALARADLIVITRCDLVQDTTGLVACIQRYTNAPIIQSRQCLGQPQSIHHNEVNAGNAESTQPWLLVSGIGNPAAFNASVLAAGHAVSGHLTFPDHHHFTAQDVEAINAQAQITGARVLCTEKDAIKCRELADTTDWCMVPLRVEMDEDQRDQLLHVVTNVMGKMLVP